MNFFHVSVEIAEEDLGQDIHTIGYDRFEDERQ